VVLSRQSAHSNDKDVTVLERYELWQVLQQRVFAFVTRNLLDVRIERLKVEPPLFEKLARKVALIDNQIIDVVLVTKLCDFCQITRVISVEKFVRSRSNG
jgi:hypothetical protein